LVILSKIRVGGGWKIVRSFADKLTIVGENRRRIGNLSELNCTRLALSLQRISKRNEYETDYYSNLYDAPNDEHECQDTRSVLQLYW